jgi:aminopeptidase-like protein
MIELAKRLFPINRSITGDGVRQTLSLISEYISLKIFEIPSGTKAFDWVVPKEWIIRDGYVKDDRGKRVIDYKENNLHVVSYSKPVDMAVPLSKLKNHLHTLPDQPDAIPYMTSYYQENWGFCLSDLSAQSLKDGTYKVLIDSEFVDGSLTYGEILVPGEREEEIFISTDICHPSMANNEISGPVVATFIAEWLKRQHLTYTYRIIFIPETIGSIVYLSRNLEKLRKNVVAGFVLSCIGDERCYSCVASPYGDTLSDKVATEVLSSRPGKKFRYSYLDGRGSDERHYSSPGADLPMVTLCRSKFGTYPEYHTSLDDFSVVTENGLLGGFEYVKECIELIEKNRIYKSVYIGEPNLGKRGLYQTITKEKGLGQTLWDRKNVLAYANGQNDLFDLSKITGRPTKKLIPVIDELVEYGLLRASLPMEKKRPGNE